MFTTLCYRHTQALHSIQIKIKTWNEMQTVWISICFCSSSLCCVLFMLLHVFLIVSREIITPDHVAFKQAPSGFTAVKGTVIKKQKIIHWWELKWPDGTVIVYEGSVYSLCCRHSNEWVSTAMCKTRWRLWPEPTAGGELVQIPHPSPAAVKEFESEKQLIIQLQNLLGWFLHSKLPSTLWKTWLIIQ